MGSISVLLNLQRVRTIPLGHLVPVFLGLETGLALGTNSFAALDLSDKPFLSGHWRRGNARLHVSDCCNLADFHLLKADMVALA